MQARGQIQRILPDGSAEVRVTRESSCGGCADCAGCSARGVAAVAVAANPGGLALVPGDIVTVETPDKNVLLLSLYAYIAPAALFFGVYLLLSPHFGDKAGLLGGGAAVCLKIALDVVINRFVLKCKPGRRPVITHKISEEKP